MSQQNVEIVRDGYERFSATGELKVVALLHKRGRSKAAGMPVEMSFAQVWTIRDGKQSRMDMYSDSGEALEAAGLSE